MDLETYQIGRAAIVDKPLLGRRFFGHIVRLTAKTIVVELQSGRQVTAWPSRCAVYRVKPENWTELLKMEEAKHGSSRL